MTKTLLSPLKEVVGFQVNELNGYLAGGSSNLYIPSTFLLHFYYQNSPFIGWAKL